MKIIKKYILLIPVIFAFSILSLVVFADPPDPPPVPGGHGGGGNVGAPIDGGVGILLVLGFGYGCRKIFQMKKKKVRKNTRG